MMMLVALSLALALPTIPLDTTVTFGVVRRDLTGDTIPEVLTLVGVGPNVENLQVTFTITSAGDSLRSQSWKLTPRSFDPLHQISAAEYRKRLSEYGDWFFAESRFMSPASFLTWLGTNSRRRISRIPEVIARDIAPRDTTRARQIWDEMQSAGITIFKFSPGGDRIQFLGWSTTQRRFYDLVDCC